MKLYEIEKFKELETKKLENILYNGRNIQKIRTLESLKNLKCDELIMKFHIKKKYGVMNARKAF
jgi:hypothetical protein